MTTKRLSRVQYFVALLAMKSGISSDALALDGFGLLLLWLLFGLDLGLVTSGLSTIWGSKGLVIFDYVMCGGIFLAHVVCHCILLDHVVFLCLLRQGLKKIRLSNYLHGAIVLFVGFLRLFWLGLNTLGHFLISLNILFLWWLLACGLGYKIFLSSLYRLSYG